MDKILKLLLVCVLCALVMSIIMGIGGYRVEARDGREVGRYQISTWAHQTIGFNGIIGYVVIDTTTGDVVKKWSGDLKGYRAEEQASEIE